MTVTSECHRNLTPIYHVYQYNPKSIAIWRFSCFYSCIIYHAIFQTLMYKTFIFLYM